MQEDNQEQPEGEITPVENEEATPSPNAEPEGEAQDGEQPEQDSEAEPKPKKRSGFQKRISGLTDKIRQQQEQIDKLTATREQPAVAEPNRDDFSDYEQYLEARVDWKADQKFAERQADLDAKQADRERKAQERDMETRWEDSTDTAREKHEDFDDVAFGEVNITETMGLAIKDSKIGGEIAYHLGKNVEEADRIARLAPLAQIKAIGRIEEKLETAPAREPPPKPVKRGRTSQSTASNKLTDNMSTADWVRMRNKEVHG